MPHLRVGPDGEYLGVRLVQGPAELRPGDSADVVFDGIDYSALRVGARFGILEGPRPVGEGEVAHERIEEIRYEYVRGSDVDRDGMLLELDRIAGSQRETVCEVFYSDVDGRFTFSAYVPELFPLEHVEELIRRARESLVPRP
jgi:hypothetical protein